MTFGIHFIDYSKSLKVNTIKTEVNVVILGKQYFVYTRLKLFNMASTSLCCRSNL